MSLGRWLVKSIRIEDQGSVGLHDEALKRFVKGSSVRIDDRAGALSINGDKFVVVRSGRAHTVDDGKGAERCGVSRLRDDPLGCRTVLLSESREPQSSPTQVLRRSTPGGAINAPIVSETADRNTASAYSSANFSEVMSLAPWPPWLIGVEGTRPCSPSACGNVT
jgi:hypothetical protein